MTSDEHLPSVERKDAPDPEHLANAALKRLFLDDIIIQSQIASNDCIGIELPRMIPMPDSRPVVPVVLWMDARKKQLAVGDLSEARSQPRHERFYGKRTPRTFRRARSSPSGPKDEIGPEREPVGAVAAVVRDEQFVVPGAEREEEGDRLVPGEGRPDFGRRGAPVAIGILRGQ